MSYPGKKERIVATVEARMTSSRLPGKVLLPIGGMPALELLVRRLRCSRYLDDICIATTTNQADDELGTLAKRLAVPIFRGSETDVLRRVLDAARSQRADIIVEITGDCPFVDPLLVDRGIEEFFGREVDYASNTLEPTYPNGFDVQVFPTAILADVAAKTKDPIDRAHVSYYIYQHPELYRLHNWTATEAALAPQLRVTLDEQADYDVLERIAQHFSATLANCSAIDIVGYLRSHPEIVAINKDVRQKEAYEL